MLSETDLLAADRQARVDALDVERSFIVQAPAGSGKTELLIQRYLKLLAVVEVPEEILAITFTRKAAAEMQQRVVAALQTHAAGNTGREPHEQLTRDLAAAALRRNDELGWRLLESPRRMRIQTLDAFCSGIARSLPISSGLGVSVNTLADAAMRATYRTAAAATLDSLAPDQEARLPVERVLRHLDNNTALYIAYISRMLATRDQWLHMVGGGHGVAQPDGAQAVRRQLEKNIGDLISRNLRQARDAIPGESADELLRLAAYAAESLSRQDRPAHPLTRIGSFSELPGSSPADRDAWQALANLLLTQTGGWRKRLNKNDGFPSGDHGQKQALLDLLENFAAQDELWQALQRVRNLPPPQYSDDQWDVLLALFQLLPLAYAELRRLFAEQGVSDHIEVALAAGAALGSVDEPGDMAMVLDHSIRHLLVDEMQDTSIRQYRLLDTLLAGWQRGDGRTLFCVGDPMQSIYRFRDAEVGRFLQARRDGIGDVVLQPLLLRQNFRSGENLVHWFNTVFAQVLPLQDDLTTGAISYAASVPVDKNRGAGQYRVHPLFDVEPQEEAEYGVATIRKCLAENSGDVAVLVRSRTQLPLLLAQLRAAGIAYQAIEIDRLTDLPEIIDVLALTRAFCHDADRLAWLALLRGPWVGLTWSDVHALVVNDGKSTALELLHDAVRVARLSADGQARAKHFLHAISGQITGHRNRSLRQRIEVAWYALRGPQLLQDRQQLDNVYRFFEVLDKIGTAGTLADVRELENLLDDERVSSDVQFDCRLQIMTMHRAKGLQFEHVLLYGLGRAAAGGSKAVLSWLNLPNDQGDSDMIISPVGPRSAIENDPLHEYIEATEKEREQIELDRLMYVACTRARHSLHLLGHVAVNADGDQYSLPHAGSLLRRLWPAIEHDFARSFASYQRAKPRPAQEQDPLVQPVLRRLAMSEAAQQAPALPAAEVTAKPDTTVSQRVEYYWVGSAARHAGTIVHRWLQRVADGSVSLIPDDLAAIYPLNEKLAQRLGVRRTEIDEVCERVAAALRGMLSDPRGQWLLSGDGYSELSISGIWEQRPESIVIDRVRIDDGVHWIIDYKTSSHEGGSLQRFLQQESERYRPQLEKYAALYGELTDAPVRAALYFPLLQEFCELT